jgi:DNA-binding NarL/FixJ family response regulator
MKPRILIAEDDFLILEGSLRPTVSRDFEVVAVAGDGEEAVTKAEHLRPDVVLLDVSLPKLRGFDAARKILISQPGCKVLFVSNYWDGAYIEAAREMGAGGYVFKSRVVTELTSAIRTALGGGFYEPSV